MTVLIIVINVAVFIVFQGASFSGEQVKTKPLLEYGMLPYRVTHPGKDCAIAAVLGGYLLLYPRARLLTIVFIFFFFTFIEIPAIVMLGIWFVLQFLPAVGQ